MPQTLFKRKQKWFYLSGKVDLSKENYKERVSLYQEMSIYQEDITILKVYAPNNTTAKYAKQKLTVLKWEQIYSYRWRLQHLSVTDRTAKQKITEDIEEFNNTVNQQNLLDIYRTLHVIEAYTFFSKTHQKYNKVDHKRKPQQILKNWNYTQHALQPH